MEIILVSKVVHIIGFVAWFAGLFYLVRMFVYHAEALEETGEKREILCSQYELMESRVYKIICNPAMIITWLAGLLMLYIYGFDWFRANIWMHWKLLFLVGLSAYQGLCSKWMKQLKKRISTKSSFQFRLLNEFPTVMLFIIVPIATFKNATNPIILAISIVSIVLLLIIFTKIYKNIRAKNPMA